jgi:hypothetical protein
VIALLLRQGDVLREHEGAESTILVLTRGLLQIKGGGGERTVSSPSLIRLEAGECHGVQAVIECQLVLWVIRSCG